MNDLAQLKKDYLNARKSLIKELHNQGRTTEEIRIHLLHLDCQVDLYFILFI